MENFYPHAPAYPPYYQAVDGDPSFMHHQDGYMQNIQDVHPSLSSEHLRASFADLDEDSKAVLPGQTQPRMRRKIGNSDVKHKRTRSGCFTCRNRRVKCDETHPMCERCRKGNRECVYPSPQEANPKSKSGSKSKSAGSPRESASSDDEAESSSRKHSLPTIPDEDGAVGDLAEIADHGLPTARHSRRAPSDTPSLTHDKSPSPSTEGSSSVSAPLLRPGLLRTAGRASTKRKATPRSLEELPPDVQFYLNYHKTQITYHHYAHKHDVHDFLGTTFLEIALGNEPLLYAVVGFAAYQYTLQQPDGKIHDFLKYYNRSVSLLLGTIKRSQKHTVPTLLCILELASIEELLGDWVNLQGHQKAACKILTSIYTPQTIMQDETSRTILKWYMRFDLFVGLQSGYEAVLDREWMQACLDFYGKRALENPDSLECKYEERFAFTKAMAVDVAMLFARKFRGAIDDETFEAEAAGFLEMFSDWPRNLDASLVNPENLVSDFSDWPAPDPDDIVNPFDPHVLWSGDNYSTNFIYNDIYAMELMFRYQLTSARQEAPGEELTRLSYRIAQLFDAVSMYPGAKNGAVLEAQASLGMACLFLPKDERHIQWCRRKFALIESLGYTYPDRLRHQWTDLWGIDVTQWWFPNDEYCPPVVRSLREFTKNRSGLPRDQISEDLKAMRGLFGGMNLDDTSETSSSRSRSIDATAMMATDPAEGVDFGVLEGRARPPGESPEYNWS